MFQSNIKQVTKIGLIIWFLAALFFLYEFFLRAFLGSVFYEVSRALKINAEQISLIDAAYYVTYGLMQIPVGILVDRFGVKRLLTSAVLISSFGVLLFSLSHGFYFAILSRVLMGFGSAFAFICLLILSLNWMPKKHTGFFFGFAQFIGAMGPVLASAPLVMALYVMHDNWRFMLAIIAAFGVFLALLIMFVVKDQPAQSTKKAIYNAHSMSLKKVLQQIFRNSKLWWIVLYSAATYMAIALLGTLWGVTFLEARGVSHQTASIITMLLWFGLAVGCPLLGVLSDYFQRRKYFLIFCAVLGLLASTFIIYWPGHQVAIFAILFFMLGVAGAGQNIAFVLIAEKVDSDLHATALGFNNMSISFVNLLFIPLIGFFIQLTFHGHFVYGQQIYQLQNFILPFSVMPVLYVLGIIISIRFISD